MAINNADYPNNPSMTYTLDQFIAMKFADEMTFYNFSIMEVVNGLKIFDHNIIEDYIEELGQLCISCQLTDEQYKKYKYSPDLLAFDVYGSVQLDFIILLANDMVDPKEFDLKTVKLLKASVMKEFLRQVYNAERSYIEQNRSDNGLKIAY